MTKNAMGYDDSLFTDQDPLIGTSYYNPTAAVDAITHTVEMPKPKYPTIEKQMDIHKISKEMVEHYDKTGEYPIRPKNLRPSENRDWHLARREAHTMIEYRDAPHWKFMESNHKPKIALHERVLHSILVKGRKNLRKRGKRGKLYHFLSEQWWKQFNRLGGYKSEVVYRRIGERSHQHEEKKLQRALDSWK